MDGCFWTKPRQLAIRLRLTSRLHSVGGEGLLPREMAKSPLKTSLSPPFFQEWNALEAVSTPLLLKHLQCDDLSQRLMRARPVDTPSTIFFEALRTEYLTVLDL